MGMGSMEVTVAATEREVHQAAVALWPFVQSGQVGFPLAGKKSREGLETVWSSHPEREGDELYIVRCGPVIMGACGFFLSDAKNAQTVCGPVAVNSHEAVYAQLLANMQERHPLASIIVGISHRHVAARAWLKSAGELLERCLPFEGINLAGSRKRTSLLMMSRTSSRDSSTDWLVTTSGDAPIVFGRIGASGSASREGTVSRCWRRGTT